jgi:hypothetical protein
LVAQFAEACVCKWKHHCHPRTVLLRQLLLFAAEASIQSTSQARAGIDLTQSEIRADFG